MKFKAALLGLPLLILLLYWHSSRPDAANVAPPQQPKPARASTDAWLAGARAMPQAPQADPDVPLALQLERLIAADGAAGAFQAYLLVQSCVDFAAKGDVEKFDMLPEPHMRGLTDEERKAQKIVCSGMTERIKMSRIEHLAMAAKAGVRSADGAFLRAGPFGDPSALKTRPDDPLVVAWRRQAAEQLAAGARAGDVSSIVVLMSEYSGYGESLVADPLLALRYAYAMGLIFEDMQRKSNTATIPNPFGPIVDRAKGGLTPEAVAAAQAAGKALADNVNEQSRR
jgi:hypothetical protein